MSLDLFSQLKTRRDVFSLKSSKKYYCLSYLHKIASRLLIEKEIRSCSRLKIEDDVTDFTYFYPYSRSPKRKQLPMRRVAFGLIEVTRDVC